MKKFYTYFYFRKNGTPYYVGKGCGNRAFTGKHYVPVPERSRVFLQYWETEEEALKMEKWWINFFGRKEKDGILINLSDGGGGLSNPASHIRTKMREAKLGKKRIISPEHRLKLSAALKGRKPSQQYIEARKSLVVSPETREKLRKVNFGKKYSEATKYKHRLDWIGYKNPKRKNMPITNIYEQLERDEGFRDKPYKDSRGFSTCGIGHNLDANPLSGEVYPMSYDRAMEVLKQDVTRIWLKLLGDLPWITNLDAVREGVLINCAFNMGDKGLEQFHHMLEFIKEGNYEQAAQAGEQSLWFTQVGDRAKRLMQQLRTGTWV